MRCEVFKSNTDLCRAYINDVRVCVVIVCVRACACVCVRTCAWLCGGYVCVRVLACACVVFAAGMCACVFVRVLWFARVRVCVCTSA